MCFHCYRSCLIEMDKSICISSLPGSPRHFNFIFCITYRLQQNPNHLNMSCLYVQARNTCVTAVVGLHVKQTQTHKCFIYNNALIFLHVWNVWNSKPSPCTASFWSLLLTGCPVQVTQHSLEAHLCVCEYRSTVCASGCGYALSNAGEAQHNCISELRAELDLLR